MDCTIREVGKTIAKLEGATIEEIEAAAAPSDPFSEQDRIRMRAIEVSGRRIHLMLCGGTRYLSGKTFYIVCDSAKEARDKGWRSLTSV